MGVHVRRKQSYMIFSKNWQTVQPCLDDACSLPLLLLFCCCCCYWPHGTSFDGRDLPPSAAPLLFLLLVLRLLQSQQRMPHDSILGLQSTDEQFYCMCFSKKSQPVCRQQVVETRG